jgi:DNA repair exonuclease SbcCD ATPase subunit
LKVLKTALKETQKELLQSKKASSGSSNKTELALAEKHFEEKVNALETALKNELESNLNLIRMQVDNNSQQQQQQQQQQQSAVIVVDKLKLFNEDLEEVQKNVKELQLDEKLLFENLQQEINHCKILIDQSSDDVNTADHKQQVLDDQIKDAMLKQNEAETKLREMQCHLEHLHGELGKSIHIIDKHSLEMDELNFKIEECKTIKENQCDKVDLQDSIKIMQKQLVNFTENFNNLSTIPGQLEAFKVEIKDLKDVINDQASKNDTNEGQILKLMSPTPRKKSITPPSPKPREKSALRSDIDDLKTALADNQTGIYYTVCIAIMIMGPYTLIIYSAATVKIRE